MSGENDEVYDTVSGFSVFAFDKIESESFSLNGRFAAKNSIEAKGFNITPDGNDDCTKNDYKYSVYTDKFIMGSWGGSVRGGIHYKSQFETPDYIKQNILNNHCEISNNSSEDIDFDAIKNKVNEISEQLLELQANSEVRIIFKSNI